jgi:cation diffusion facilitator CzcD-associated flavoprotein CzcO
MLASKDTGEAPTDVIIIGSGFSGLGLAVALKREGRHNFVVVERAGEVGGTWRDNTYPGAACDIPSHLYSFSFRPNPNWSSTYASQAEIFQYLRAVAKEEHLLPHIRFNTTVTRVVWDAGTSLWAVETNRGWIYGRALVAAAGHLSDPSVPDISGIEQFGGQIFHSAKWDHGFDAQKQRVGVIGTGASAIQIVPELAKLAEHLVVFQRSAPYIVPRRDAPFSLAEQRMFARLPRTRQALRDELFWFNEGRFLQRRRVDTFIAIVAAMAQDHLNSQVQDLELKRKLTPAYEIGCKRILISNDFYPALAQPNVTLEAAGIEQITPEGVRCRDGRFYPLDAIILATGFEATNLPIAEVIYGRNGRRLADEWAAGPNAYACTTVSGFPNFFMMLGPNTGLGAGSMVYMAETQANYIKEGLAFLLGHDMDIEPDPASQQSYVDDLHRRSEGTVWVAGGCSSWYLHPTSGKLTALWPDFMGRFRAENGSFSEQGYVTTPRKMTVEASAG